jgi:hypothetical protein
LSNTHFKKFLNKIYGIKSTSSNNITQRKCWLLLPGSYYRNKTKSSEKENLGVDRQEDRFIAPVIIGISLPDRADEIFLLNFEHLKKIKSLYSIFSILKCSVFIMAWQITSKRRITFLSDSAPYMTKEGDTLKVLYTEMIHVTCTSHGLHRTAEKIHI